MRSGVIECPKAAVLARVCPPLFLCSFSGMYSTYPGILALEGVPHVAGRGKPYLAGRGMGLFLCVGGEVNVNDSVPGQKGRSSVLRESSARAERDISTPTSLPSQLCNPSCITLYLLSSRAPRRISDAPKGREVALCRRL